jgi:hypothetical protein
MERVRISGRARLLWIRSVGQSFMGPYWADTMAQFTEKRIAMTFLFENFPEYSPQKNSPEYLETFYPSYY